MWSIVYCRIVELIILHSRGIRRANIAKTVYDFILTICQLRSLSFMSFTSKKLAEIPGMLTLILV